MPLFRAHDEKLASFGRCFPLWKRREEVYQDMQKDNFSRFQLCEPSTFPGGDCRFFDGGEAASFAKQGYAAIVEDEL